MHDIDMFTSYSLRRSMPTLAEMSGTHPDDADALGDWTATRDRCALDTPTLEKSGLQQSS